MKLKVGYKELIEQAETEIKCLTVPDAADLAQKEKVEFIDIRDIQQVGNTDLAIIEIDNLENNFNNYNFCFNIWFISICFCKKLYQK